MEIIIRPFHHDKDVGLIYATFTKGLFFGSKDRPKKDHIKFTQEFSPFLKELIQRATIFIACTKQDPDFLVGYTIIDNHILQWVFVKPDYRKNGIATLLVKNKDITAINEKNLSRTGNEILKNHPNLFKPIPSQKEESHERPVEETH